MNLIKKLLKFLLVLVFLAGIGFGAWYFFADQVMTQVNTIQESIEKDKENAALAEQNKDFLVVLDMAKKHINEADLVECDVYTKYSSNAEMIWESTTAMDSSICPMWFLIFTTVGIKDGSA